MDERTWNDRPLGPDETLSGDGARLVRASTGPSALISGDLTRAIAALAPGAPMLGLGDAAPAGPHAIRIGRDRALLIDAAPLPPAGWHETGFAVSLADGLYVPLDLTGDRADEIMSEATSAPLTATSPSAAVLVVGWPALVTRSGGGWRIRVEQPALTALTSWFRVALAGPTTG